MLNSLTSSVYIVIFNLGIVYVDKHVILKYKIFSWLFSQLYAFSSSFLPYCPGTSSTLLYKSGESGYPCLAKNFQVRTLSFTVKYNVGESFSFSVFWTNTSYQAEKILCFYFLRIFIMRVESYEDFFMNAQRLIWLYNVFFSILNDG